MSTSSQTTAAGARTGVAWTGDVPYRVSSEIFVGEFRTRSVSEVELFSTLQEAQNSFLLPRKRNELRRHLDRLVFLDKPDNYGSKVRLELIAKKSFAAERRAALAKTGGA